MVLDQCIDHFAECEETLVDVSGFSGALVDCAGSSDVFRAGQVDEVELSDSENFLSTSNERVMCQDEERKVERRLAACVFFSRAAGEKERSVQKAGFSGIW